MSGELAPWTDFFGNVTLRPLIADPQPPKPEPGVECRRCGAREWDHHRVVPVCSYCGQAA